MGLPLSVTRALDDFIALMEEPREPDGMYHPSSFWVCLRALIYEVRGEERTNPPDAKAKRRFKLGHLIHDLVQKAVGMSPEVDEFYPEFEVNIPELNITGHGDGLVFLKGGLVVPVLEVKSINSRGFRYTPKDDHIKQASIYTLAARKYGVDVVDYETGEVKRIEPLGDRVTGILLFYIEKEQADSAEYFIDWDPQWEQDIEARVAEADLYRNDPESLPPRLPLVKGKKPWKCSPQYCDFYRLCMGQDAGGVEPKTAAEGLHW